SPPAARSDSTAAFTDCGSRSLTTIRAPSAAKRRAAASPCPLPAPVINATLPCNCPMKPSSCDLPGFVYGKILQRYRAPFLQGLLHDSLENVGKGTPFSFLPSRAMV